MASSIATITAPGCLALMFLLPAGYTAAQDGWSPRVRRNPLSLTPTKGHVVNMNDPFAMAYIVQDVRNQLEAGAWRWTSRRPELRIYLDDTRGLKFTTDFSVPERGLGRTGPVTISFLINGQLLDRVRCDQPGDRHFEKPVPESWLHPRWLNFVRMEPDKTWSDAEFTHGFILTRAGFAPN
ncbi:MAG TPA: hypothetical protein VNH18_22200 [Bryobacteraceae bacterium]|nr:hypothetical protein [Bryobacteraceae bacterium]